MVLSNLTLRQNLYSVVVWLALYYKDIITVTVTVTVTEYLL